MSHDCTEWWTDPNISYYSNTFSWELVANWSEFVQFHRTYSYDLLTPQWRLGHAYCFFFFFKAYIFGTNHIIRIHAKSPPRNNYCTFSHFRLHYSQKIFWKSLTILLDMWSPFHGITAQSVHILLLIKFLNCDYLTRITWKSQEVPKTQRFGFSFSISIIDLCVSIVTVSMKVNTTQMCASTERNRCPPKQNQMELSVAYL